MDSTIPKNETEHAAAKEIAGLQFKIKELRSKVDQMKGKNEERIVTLRDLYEDIREIMEYYWQGQYEKDDLVERLEMVVYHAFTAGKEIKESLESDDDRKIAFDEGFDRGIVRLKETENTLMQLIKATDQTSSRVFEHSSYITTLQEQVTELESCAKEHKSILEQPNKWTSRLMSRVARLEEDARKAREEGK
jgi:chromosome segregation ATPase